MGANQKITTSKISRSDLSITMRLYSKEDKEYDYQSDNFQLIIILIMVKLT